MIPAYTGFRTWRGQPTGCIVSFRDTCSSQSPWRSWPGKLQPITLHVTTLQARGVLDCVWNVMAHAQKPDFVFRQNGRVHLNRRGPQFSRLPAAEVCALAVVMLDTPRSEVVWRVLATHSIRQFPLHFPSRASPCAITFQLESTTGTPPDYHSTHRSPICQIKWLCFRILMFRPLVLLIRLVSVKLAKYKALLKWYWNPSAVRLVCPNETLSIHVI